MTATAGNLLLLAVLLTWPTVATSQQSKAPAGKAITYEFVSPNTSEGLKLEDALKKLDSEEEQALIRETHSVTCRIGAKPRINKSLGVWADGAENSTVFQIYADEPAARYAGASLGKFARQKAVLYFRQDRGGKARMYVINVTRPRSPARVSETLGQTGITYRTLVPLKGRTVVYIVDLSNELHSRVQRAARRLRTRPVSVAGTGEFIGDDNDRDKAEQAYKREIENYESTHPPVERKCPPSRGTTSN